MGEQGQIVAPTYSYHTFVFPFLWNRGGEVKREEFEKCIDRNQWMLDQYDVFDNCDNKTRIATSRKERYDQYQYFNAPARNAIYMTEDSQQMIVRNFQYKPDFFTKENTGAFYVIHKGDLHYVLSVNGLRLKLYNSGIGLLIYELENSKYRSMEDVTRINEFGRRVYCPFIFDVSYLTSSLTADSISLVGTGFPKNVPDREWNITADAYDTKKTPRMKLAKVVSMLLTNGNVTVTTDENEASNEKFYIEPIIDDRMFVACFVRDESFANLLKDWNDGEYRWLSDSLEKQPDADDNIARQLYEFVFVDGTGISCLNRTMLHDSLLKHIYSRWAEYGTFHGITEYSMMCVSSAKEDYIAKNPFLTQYTELAYLTIAQRASLIAFARQISRVSKDFSCVFKELKKARKLMEDYVRFQSQLLLTEVTAQQQGIEIYNILLESLYVNQQKDDAEKRVSKLFELSNNRIQTIENIFMLIIAALGFISVADVLGHWFGWLK